jgi:acetyltransferase
MHSPANGHYLAPLFEPASVAVIGASARAGSIGAVLLGNMLAANFNGRLFAVNPGHRSVQGVRCYPSIGSVPGKVDLAVIVTPAATAPELIDECGRAGVRAAVVISAGFGETGTAGAALEKAMLENARRHQLRLLGPNCLGIMRPSSGLNATFARGNARAGSLGLISQSGAVCTALIDWAVPNGIGFSSIVSLGASTDVDFGELIDYLVNDPATAHILLYIEGVRDARRFVSALRAAARVKPVVLMKVGRYPAGSRAVQSHTGAMVGADDVFEAVVRRTGVVRVKTIGQLVAAAQALAARIRPQGNRLAIITNGGGPGVMAADRATELGLPLATLAPATVAALQPALPATWSHGNPLDLIGDADAARYRAAVSACLADPGVDGALVILTPQAMTDAVGVAEAVIDSAQASQKPLLACWMGEQSVAAARPLFAAAGIPVLRTPEPAVDMFAHVSAFYLNQQTLLQVPAPLEQQTAPDTATAARIIEAALAQGRRALTQTEARAVLAAFHIPVARALTAQNAEEAVQRAQEIGYPVVLKIDSAGISHKSDVDGIRLNLDDAAAVRHAYAQVIANAARLRPAARIDGVVIETMLNTRNTRELMVGMTSDPVFGPVITFAAGGTAVEVLRDRALDLPPLNLTLVRALIGRTRIARMLGAFRELPPVDMAALEAVLLRVSEMACELPWLTELDINPLIAGAGGVTAVDARIVIAPRAPARRPYAHLAIHPYPTELVTGCTLADGETLTLRPIRPEDACMEQDFVRGLSPTSRYFRFMGSVRELTPLMLARFTQIDYDREMAFVAVRREGNRGAAGNYGGEIEIAVARYHTNADGSSCEFAIVIDDAWQRRGLGRVMMQRLIAVARARGLATMIGHIISTNTSMLALCAELGFSIEHADDDATARRAVLDLTAAA